jgi:polygalacturonase
VYSDGFSAGGTNLTFENNHIENGDDCLTVGSGASNIIFRNSYCEGGHGLSIGSLGKGGSVASVNNVLIQNVVMKNSLYAARFKSWTGGNGLAKNITWENIFFTNVMFPVSGPFLTSLPKLLIACRFTSPKITGTRALARARTLPH